MATVSRGVRNGSPVLAALAILVVGAVYLLAPTPLSLAELAAYNEQFRLRGPRPPSPRVVVVAIDEASLASIGRWPWPRSVLADLVRRLTDAGAAAIALDILMPEPEESGELRAARELEARLAGAPPAVREALARLRREADHDAQLAAAIRASGRVVLASRFDLVSGAPAAPPAREGAPLKGALTAFRDYAERGVFPPVSTRGAAFPVAPLLDAAASVGHANMLADGDGTTRWELLVLEHRGWYYPSLALETVRVAAGLAPTALRLDFGQDVALGGVSIPTDPRARVLVDYAGPTHTYPYLAAVDVLRGGVLAEQLRDRLVFVGATAEGTYDLRVTPFSPVFPGVEKHANMAGDILAGRFIVRPAWVELVEAAGIVFFPLLLAFVVPRVRPVPSVAVVAGIWLVFAGVVHLAFRHGLWLPVIYPTLALATTFLAITILRVLTEERQRLWIKRAFQQYVAPGVVARIAEDPSALQFGGEVRTLTVLFTDIRDFTTYSERHAPQEVVAMLHEYLTQMTAIVLDEGGTLDKYIGDAIMAIFGAPVALPDHAARACRAAVRMTDELERLRLKWEAEGKEPLRMGIGINTAAMVVGNLGSDQLFDYTVIGDGVNLGARLESLNKEYKTDRAILISEATYVAARDAVVAWRLATVTVKGKTEGVVVYELVGLARDATRP